jgi:hypothetical protein
MPAEPIKTCKVFSQKKDNISQYVKELKIKKRVREQARNPFNAVSNN